MRTFFHTILLLAASIAMLFPSCVPQRKMEEEKSKRDSCGKELSALKISAQDCETRLQEAKVKISDYEKQISGLRKDTVIIGANLRNLTAKYDKLNLVNEQIHSKYDQMVQGNVAETKKLSGELQLTQEEL